MKVMNQMSGNQLLALARKIDELEADVSGDGEVTAEDKTSIVRQIEVLRKKLRRNADDLEYDNTQLLADRLREVTHILSDLISAKAVKGGDTKLLQKLANTIITVTKALSFGGEDDADNDGFKDDADVGFLDNGSGPSPEDMFHDAVKKALNGGKTEKSETPSNDKAPAKDEKPAKTDEDNEEKSKSEDKKPKKSEDKETKDEKETKPKKSKSGGFMDSLDEANSSVTAGLRFSYIGIKVIKVNGEKTRVLKAVYGSTDKSMITAYYYAPTKKLFDGDIDRANAAFNKTLKEKNGYHALATFIPKLIKSGKLVQIKKKVVDVTSELHDDKPDRYWSYVGVQAHPTNEDKKSIWFEIGDKQFAAMPSKKFERGDVNEASNWIKINILGNKDASGKSYLNGLKALEDLVHSGKLKVIFHAAV